jgi:hypothetical protein
VGATHGAAVRAADLPASDCFKNARFGAKSRPPETEYHGMGLGNM